MLDLSKVKISTAKSLTVKDGSFPNESVITLRKPTLSPKGKSMRSLELSANAYKAIKAQGSRLVCFPKYVISTDANGLESVNLVIAGTETEKFTIDKRVVKSYLINDGTRSVTSKDIFDAIVHKFDLDDATDHSFMLNEVDGVFTLTRYVEANLNNHEEVEIKTIEIDNEDTMIAPY
jgi:hypothetical protein